MSSHIYTWISVAVTGVVAAFSAFRAWRSVARSEAVVDVNYLIAWLQGRDPSLTPDTGTLEFSRERFPFVFWLIVAFWAILCVIFVLISIFILRIGVN